MGPLQWACALAATATAADLAVGAAAPTVATPLGVAVGSYPAAGVERYGGIPYARPPIGPRRFARAEVNDEPWHGGELDARRLGPPCVQNPLGDPRSQASESGPPTEDCLHLNLWRPSSTSGVKPVMVYLFGGGLCAGFAGNEWFNGSNLALQHDVIVVTVQYRLGALGFMVGDDPSRPGSGGMNGIYDNIVALQWLHKYVGAFGGDPKDITIFGQSSGSYSVCTLCVAPAARGLFKRAGLLSGPCFGGPPGRGWGPGSLEKGRQVAEQVLASHGGRSLEDLREAPAEAVQWPGEWMSDVDKAPFFSGYFEDPSVLPAPADELWRRGEINPEAIIVSFTSKDGTAAFYGTAPTLGRVGTDENTSTPEGYLEKIRAAWGEKADQVLAHYPLSSYPTATSAFIQADADAYVICPSRRLAAYAASAGRRVWVSEFAHFQPSPAAPQGCSDLGPKGCRGFGCDNGVELDVVPAEHSEATGLWASHGASYKFVFGTEEGPDGLGPPNNRSFCAFSKDEADLSRQMMAHWASFARHGDPNRAAVPGSVPWPAARRLPSGKAALWRLRFSVRATDGVPSSVLPGVYDSQCDFWDALYLPQRQPQDAVEWV